KEKQIDEVIEFIRKEVNKGHSIYVVAPLIEESETLDLMTTEEVYMMFKEAFGESKVELVHGRMKPDEKNKEMERFEWLEVKILDSTTAIEPGSNHKDETEMMNYNDESFRLSTHHQ